MRHKGAVKNAISFNRSPLICDTCGEGLPLLPLAELAGHARPQGSGAFSMCRGTTYHRRRIFSLSLGDWLDDEVPVELRAEMMKTVHDTPNCDWLPLTKRPENFDRLMEETQDYHFDHGDRNVAGWISDWRKHGIAPLNVWIGTSCENQQAANERLPLLLKIPAKVRFISAEPLLGPLEFSDLSGRSDVVEQLGKTALDGIHWVIAGGESGKGARPCNVEWLRGIVAQCKAAGVAAFVKQFGGNPFVWNEEPHQLDPLPLKDQKGGDMAEWPEDLRVRQFPQV